MPTGTHRKVPEKLISGQRIGKAQPSKTEKFSTITILLQAKTTDKTVAPPGPTGQAKWKPFRGNKATLAPGSCQRSRVRRLDSHPRPAALRPPHTREA